jgi:hypothetical protein
MAEISALTLSLPGLFVSCIQCFEFIQLGRQLEHDYEGAVLRLSSIGLRLSRWGESVGLGDPLTNEEGRNLIADAVPEAERLLTAIIERFETANAKREQFRPRASDETTIIQPDMAPAARAVHQTMQKWMSQRRMNHQNRMKTVCWAIYEKKVFDRLVADLHGLVEDLVDLFSQTQLSQRRCCQVEAAEVEDEMLGLLGTVARDNGDEMLGEAVGAEIEKRNQQGSYFEDFDIDGQEGLEFKAGRFVARGARVQAFGSSFKTFKIRGAGKVVVGDTYE